MIQRHHRPDPPSFHLVIVNRAVEKTASNAPSPSGPCRASDIIATSVGLFIGFVFIHWLHLEHFPTEGEIGILTFMDALYYGITGTVLGYGDITPLRGFPSLRP